MIIDCDGCATRTGGRSEACHGCLVAALFDTPDGIADLTPGEMRAIEIFETAGFEIEVLETPPLPVAVPVYRRRGHVA